MKRKSTNKVTQKLKIELQSLISYACYDHEDIVQGGDTMKQPDMESRMYKLYMPSNNANDDRISQLDMLLQGKGCFKGLFECNKNESKIDDNPDKFNQKDWDPVS